MRCTLAEFQWCWLGIWIGWCSNSFGLREELAVKMQSPPCLIELEVFNGGPPAWVHVFRILFEIRRLLESTSVPATNVLIRRGEMFRINNWVVGFSRDDHAWVARSFQRDKIAEWIVKRKASVGCREFIWCLCGQQMFRCECPRFERSPRHDQTRMWWCWSSSLSVSCVKMSLNLHSPRQLCVRGSKYLNAALVQGARVYWGV
jgi:hypothetical protein